MPCYDHRNSPSYIEEHEIEPLRKQVRGLKARNDQLARLLCEAAGHLELAGFEFGTYGSNEIFYWWKEHKKFDKKRGSTQMSRRRPLALPKFVDHNNYNAVSGYTVTNEEPELFVDMLGTTRVNKAVCISSSGDMLLSVILPRAREVVAVDHSYQSLAATYTKLLLLQRVSGKFIKIALRQEKYKDLNTLIQPLSEHLPEPCKKYNASFGYAWTQLRREWAGERLQLPRVTKNIVNKVTLVHGDLKDIPGICGTFDLFYASNVMEHSGRDRVAPTLGDLAQLLNPGGLLLYTAGSGNIPLQISNSPFELLNRVKGYRTSWWHVLARKKEQQ